jgi:kanamycin kinase
MLAGPPDAPVDVPASVRALAAGQTVEPVWQNEQGGLTFRVGTGGDGRYIKWAPAGSGLDLPGEAARLRWAIRTTPVPPVLATGADPDGSWLVTAAVDADSAVSPRWKQEPGRAAAAIGRGLRALHDALPVDDCPFSWTTAERVAAVDHRAVEGSIHSGPPGTGSAELGMDDALDALRHPPPAEDPVVCHGDACAPNTLLDRYGQWVAHVDLGRLGVGERWADLAVAAWSTEWNYGPGWVLTVYDAYGIEPDPERIRYFRLLWALG